jgi:ketosteroid isomerase-like protein
MGVINLRGTIIALSIVATALPGVVMAQVVADSAALHEYVERYQHAMSTHDPTAVAAFFSEDADRVPGNLPALHGRAAIEAW